jgi:hypothetical protein
MIKALRKLEIEGMYLNTVNAIYDKAISNITLNGEKLKPFSPKIRNKTRVPTIPTPIKVLEFLARAIRQETEVKGIQIGKETAKISLFKDDIILYLKDPKTPRQQIATARWQDIKSICKNY